MLRPAALICAALLFPGSLSTARAEDAPAWAQSAELEAKAKRSLGNTDFQHQLTFSEMPGMPASISGTVRDSQANTRVRAILQLDGVLLVVSLRHLPALNLYRGSFPTPRSSVTYQFQVLQADGRAVLSPLFVATPRCDADVSNQLVPEAESFPKQAELLKSAHRREARAQALIRLISSLKHLTKGGERE